MSKDLATNYRIREEIATYKKAKIFLEAASLGQVSDSSGLALQDPDSAWESPC